MRIIQRPEVESGEAEGNTQSFVISPLEPGFGHTLGNSLRRTLLSSIPGAAVTQVRFDEALHEFDTIPGVKEDVTDLILNLKDLVLRCSSEEAVSLRLDSDTTAMSKLFPGATPGAVYGAFFTHVLAASGATALTDAEAQDATAGIVEALQVKLGAVQR